jgi:tetratricopeptide (TPR) repeat protein
MKQFPSEVFDLDRLLATQKTLFKLRTKISELIEVGDLFSAHHWLLTIVNEPSMATALHWSDYYRFFKSCSVQKMPVKLILEAIESFESSQKEAADIHLTLLKVDLMAKEGIWEQIVTLSDLLDLESYGTDGFGHNWEREQFPPRWVPSISPEMIKARFFHFIGLAHRNLGAFEKAIDAFDLSTQFCPYVHASVAELMYETNALIPAAQRQQYLDTLALGSLKYSPEIELLFNAGKFEKVLEVTTPFFRDSKNLLSDDRNLLVLHLSSLLALKKSDELFVMAHKLVDAFPQDAISWYAVGLYYEANDRLDDSRRYLMYYNIAQLY